MLETLSHQKNKGGGVRDMKGEEDGGRVRDQESGKGGKWIGREWGIEQREKGRGREREKRRMGEGKIDRESDVEEREMGREGNVCE